VTFAFKVAGSMTVARSGHTATLLANSVLIAGGQNASGVLSSTERFGSSVDGVFGPSAKMAHARTHHTATLLPNGDVLVAGGQDCNGALSNAETYTRSPIGSAAPAAT
jgi:hypothetical protein